MSEIGSKLTAMYLLMHQ